MKSMKAAGFLMIMLSLTLEVRAAADNLKLTWIAGSTVRVEQIVGDCDYAE